MGIPTPTRMKLNSLLLPRPAFAAIAFLLVFAAGGCQEAKSTAPGAPPEVLVTTVTQQDVPVSKEWLATLDGSVNASIQARVQGYLTLT